MYDTVHWKALEFSVTKRPIASRLRLSKYVYRWLPIGELRQKIDPSASTLCPCCEAVVEDTQHLLTCDDPLRAEKREAQLESLPAVLADLRTPPPLITVLQTALTSCLADPDYCHPRVPGRGDPIRYLNRGITQQNHLGWTQIFLGRVAVGLQDYVELVVYNRPINTHLQRSWAADLITWAWEVFEEQWEVRNHAIHGATEAESRAKVRGKLEQRVRALYDCKDSLREADRVLLSHPVNTVLGWAPSTMCNWLRITTPAVNRCLEEMNETPGDTPA